jgi:hypothetical protein
MVYLCFAKYTLFPVEFFFQNIGAAHFSKTVQQEEIEEFSKIDGRLFPSHLCPMILIIPSYKVEFFEFNIVKFDR